MATYVREGEIGFHVFLADVRVRGIELDVALDVQVERVVVGERGTGFCSFTHLALL